MADAETGEEIEDGPHSGSMRYMLSRIAECPDCLAIKGLCSECSIEVNRRVEMEDRLAWVERLRQNDPSPYSEEFGPWLSEELNHTLSVCTYSALCNGVPIQTAIEQNFKIQWIQTELLRIGYKPESPSQPLNRLEWNCSTAVYVHIVKELLNRGYLFLPGMNAKDNDGNITELFRRLSQSITVSGRDGTELSPDELQRRFNGRALAKAKADRLTLPEAEDMK